MTPTGALSLAYWLALTSPSIYQAMLVKAHAAGLSGLGCTCRALGFLGQDDIDFSDDTETTDDSTPEIVVSATDPLGDTIAAQTATEFPTLFDTVDPTTLAPVTVSATDVAQTTAPITTTADSTSASSANTSSSALSSVGSYLASSAGVSALLQVGTAALKASAAASNAQTAQAVLAAQTARVLAGGNPAAITYTVNPATGALTPVLSTSGGLVPVTSGLLGTLSPNAATLQIGTFLTQYGIWIAAGVLLLLMLNKGNPS